MRYKRGFFWLVFFCQSILAHAGTFQTITIQQNDAFRRDVMHYVQNEVCRGEPSCAPADGGPQGSAPTRSISLDDVWFNGGDPHFYLIHWSAKVTLFFKGKRVGEGKANTASLSNTLQQATEKAMKQAKLSPTALKQTRIKVTLYYPPDQRQYSMVSEDDKIFELIGNVIPIRQWYTGLLKDRIRLESTYLLRMIDPETHALFKRYDAATDSTESVLRTTYTASGLYTLLQVQKVFPQPAIEKQIPLMANFLLNMQVKGGTNKGAFHYAYNKTTKQKDNRFIVGTVSKTIFTLLLLYERTHDDRYLKAAERGGDWLVTKVDADGRVNPVLSRKAAQWHQKTKQSFLYSGQVLSALSRLYAVDKKEAYYRVASKITERIADYVSKKGSFLGDEYRAPNSVTTSWVVMGLLDYAKINTHFSHKEMLTQSAQDLVYHQIRAPWDAFNDGRLMDIITSSGNGWVNEVMTEFYPFCKKEKLSNCAAYRHFIISSSRWLAQNVYTSANSFDIKNPARAEGGVIRNFAEQAVRTDAVCHGLNSFVGLLEIIHSENQMLRFLPERPIDEVIGLLEMGGAGEEQ